jgi:hypothetical protein
MKPIATPVSRKLSHMLVMGFAFAPVEFIYGFIHMARPILLGLFRKLHIGNGSLTQPDAVISAS